MTDTVAVETPLATTKSDDPVQTFVGQNYDYYQRKWEFVKTPGALKGFNVAAFFLGVVWMVYRKMYLYAAIITAVLLVDAVVESYYPLPEAVGKGLTWGIYVAFGLLSNLMYKTHVDKKIKEVTTSYPPEEVNIQLAKQGGVNLVGAWAFGAVLITIVGIAIWAILNEV